MQLSPKDAWKRILEEAKRELPAHAIESWLAPAQPLALEGSRLTIGAPDQFSVNWNEEKHAALLARLAEPLLGHGAEVVFKVMEERQKRPQMDFFVAPTAEPATPASAVANPSSQPLNDRYTFDNFVIGKSNEMAAAAANAVGEPPGKTYNPLFIYGATGLGKTHLMQAIAHRVLAREPHTRVLYVGAERFINEVIEGIHGRTMQNLRRRYRSEVDLFLVDDVHFLEGKEATQEEFFHTFNSLSGERRQIVLTSDRPPTEMPGLEARLVSRFQAGMVVDVGQPDLEHRIAILRKKKEQDHLETAIPDEVLAFIAEHVPSNVRELEGCIIKLILYGSLKKREITIETAREALSDKIRPAPGGTVVASSLICRKSNWPQRSCL
jgi:chromosomal replication initiator protein